MMNGMGFGITFWLILTGLVLWGVVTFVNFQRDGINLKVAGGDFDALEILKMRYARGEISREEFEKMKTGIKAV